jgi:hypothetical protein
MASATRHASGTACSSSGRVVARSSSRCVAAAPARRGVRGPQQQRHAASLVVRAHKVEVRMRHVCTAAIVHACHLSTIPASAPPPAVNMPPPPHTHTHTNTRTHTTRTRHAHDAHTTRTDRAPGQDVAAGGARRLHHPGGCAGRGAGAAARLQAGRVHDLPRQAGEEGGVGRASGVLCCAVCGSVRCCIKHTTASWACA